MKRIGLVVLSTDLFAMAVGLYELITRNYTLLVFSMAYVGASTLGFFWFQKKQIRGFREG